MKHVLATGRRPRNPLRGSKRGDNQGGFMRVICILALAVFAAACSEVPTEPVEPPVAAYCVDNPVNGGSCGPQGGGGYIIDVRLWTDFGEWQVFGRLIDDQGNTVNTDGMTVEPWNSGPGEDRFGTCHDSAPSWFDNGNYRCPLPEEGGYHDGFGGAPDFGGPADEIQCGEAVAVLVTFHLDNGDTVTGEIILEGECLS